MKSFPGPFLSYHIYDHVFSVHLGDQSGFKVIEEFRKRREGGHAREICAHIELVRFSNDSQVIFLKLFLE